jgi:hypothetical protein
VATAEIIKKKKTKKTHTAGERASEHATAERRLQFRRGLFDDCFKRLPSTSSKQEALHVPFLLHKSKRKQDHGSPWKKKSHSITMFIYQIYRLFSIFFS